MASFIRSMRIRLRPNMGIMRRFHFRRGKKNHDKFLRIPMEGGEKKFLVCFFAGLLTGTAAANFLYSSLSSQVGYYLSLLSHHTELGREAQLALFRDIARQRIIEVLIAWLIGLTVYAVPCFCLLSAGFGLSAGVILSVMTGQKGLMGLPFFLVTMMPQALIYIPVWCMLLLWGIRRNGRLRLLALVLILALVAVGSACEVWLNPLFLELIS